MVTCRLVIRCWVLIYNFDPAKRTNNSSGVPTTPMPKSVQINFLKSVFNLKSSKNSCFHTWCDSLIYRLDLRSYQNSWRLIGLGVWVLAWLNFNLIFREFEWDCRVRSWLRSYLFNLNSVSIATLSHYLWNCGLSLIFWDSVLIAF
jgi:hypothetical protein